MLTSILRDVFRRPGVPTVLNVGGYDKAIAIPPHYEGWHLLMLDIDAAREPDIVGDARELAAIPADQFDAIYCSHNLEHFYAHDVPKVLAGFLHVLKPNGFAEIKVPDIKALMEHLVKHGMDLGDPLYSSPFGPITGLDVMYGYGKEIQESGNDFWAHKTGFTPRRLHECLARAGFKAVYLFLDRAHVEMRALAFKSQPTEEQARSLALPKTTSY